MCIDNGPCSLNVFFDRLVMAANIENSTYGLSRRRVTNGWRSDECNGGTFDPDWRVVWTGHFGKRYHRMEPSHQRCRLFVGSNRRGTGASHIGPRGGSFGYGPDTVVTLLSSIRRILPSSALISVMPCFPENTDEHLTRRRSQQPAN